MNIREWFDAGRSLMTGNLPATDIDTGEVIVVSVGRRAVWSSVMPHTLYGRWVNRRGLLDCGCTRSPLTRRIVWFNGRCETHCAKMAKMLREVEARRAASELDEDELNR